jgi:hypothetical protein
MKIRSIQKSILAFHILRKSELYGTQEKKIIKKNGVHLDFVICLKSILPAT